MFTFKVKPSSETILVWLLVPDFGVVLHFNDSVRIYMNFY